MVDARNCDLNNNACGPSKEYIRKSYWLQLESKPLIGLTNISRFRIDLCP